MSDKKSYLRLVRNQIKSTEAKQFVESELDNHIEETITRAMMGGISRREAEVQAVQEMGDPIKLGLKMGRLHRPKVDWNLLGLFIILTLVGLIPLFVPNMDYPPSIFSKVIDIIFGIAIVIALMLFDYRKLKNKTWISFGIAAVFILLFYFAGRLMNSNPYIGLGPFRTNSMIVLPFLWIGWASVFHRYKKHHLFLVGLFFLTLFLYIPISSLANVFIYISLVFTMYIWTFRKEKKKLLGTIITLFAIVAGILIAFWQSAGMEARLLGFLHPEKYAKLAGYMPFQIKKYLSEAGWFGQTDKLKGIFLPDTYTDFVFVTLTYSFGWLFSIGLAIFLTAITVRIYWISRKTRDPFGQLIILGALSLYTIPFVYNIAMILGFVPIAGFWLPFISYGKITVLINSIIIGLVLSVYRRKDFFALPI